MPTRAEVVAYSRAQNAIVSAARSRLSKVWATLGDSTWDVVATRRALEKVFPALVADYGDAAATLAADWFEAQVEAKAVLARPIGADAANASMRWALGSTLDGGPTAALATLGGVVDRLVKQPGRDTIQRSALRSKVAWARVPTGASTCAFCRMVASRGAVYGSRETAGEGNAFHSDCDCVVTPVRSAADFPRGYDPAKFEQEYVDARKVAGGETKAILAEMRSQLGVS